MFIPVRNKYSLYKKIKIKNNLRIKNIIQFYVYFRAYCLSLFLQNCTNKIYKCVQYLVILDTIHIIVSQLDVFMEFAFK